MHAKRLLLLLVMLVGLSAPLSAQLNGRIVENQTEVIYQIDGKEGDTLIATVTRTSGNFIPYLVLRLQGETQFLASEAAEEGRPQVTLTIELPSDHIYELIVIHDIADNNELTGDFILRIEGVQLLNRQMPAVRYFPGVPAVVLPDDASLNLAWEGVIDDKHVITYYLLEYMSEDELVFTTEVIEGDLIAVTALVDPLSPETVLVRGEPIDGKNQLVLSDELKAGWYLLAVTRFDADLGTTTGRFRLQADH